MLPIRPPEIWRRDTPPSAYDKYDEWIQSRIGWIRKSSVLMHVIDPTVQQGDTGIVATIYTDLRSASERLATSDRIHQMGYEDEVGREFDAAVRSIEALVDYWEVIPDSEALHNTRGKLHPYFSAIPFAQDNQLVFVLMPFDAPWSERMWRSHIKPTVEGIKHQPPLRCKRADDLYGQDVLRDIVSAISIARLIIADTTSRNPNVFYELGIAHLAGKPTILLTQSTNDIPFDLLRFRHILYEDNLDGCKALRRQLKQAIRETLIPAPADAGAAETAR